MADDFSRVLVVLAHPDDPEFFCGATVARWAAEGKTIFYCLATRGDKGTSDPVMTPDRLMEIREAEQRAAAAILGVTDVSFMGYPDGYLVPDLTLRRDVARIIRQKKPDLVVTSDPNTLYTSERINHPDHRAIGLATLDAIFPTARDRLTFPELSTVEGLEPHTVQQVYLAVSLQPDVTVDITDFLDRKIAALNCHRSQIRDPEQLEQNIRRRNAVEMAGAPRYAESFKRIRLT